MNKNNNSNKQKQTFHANINYSVQGKRGGQPHYKKDVGMIETNIDHDVTITCQAFDENNNVRERKPQSQITIKKGDKTIFDNSPLFLTQILSDYYHIDLNEQT